MSIKSCVAGKRHHRKVKHILNGAPGWLHHLVLLVKGVMSDNCACFYLFIYICMYVFILVGTNTNV